MLKTFWTVLSALALATPAIAQQASIPPLVRLVVPFAAGGSTDVLARTVAAQLGPRLGTNVIVDNRAGGGGLIGAAAVANGPRDGSMLLLSTGSLVTAAATTKALPLDVNTDLLPVSLIGEGPMVIAVSTKTNLKTPADLVAAARAKPGALTYGSAGVGTIGHLGAELLEDAAKIEMLHVPYKGTSLALIDLSTGTIDLTFAIYSSLQAQIASGRVRLIGVTSREPNPAFPGVLPVSSAVPGFDATTWVAVFAPPGTPAALVQRLNREINEIAKSKEVQDQLRSDGVITTPLTPEQGGARIRASYDLWRKLAIAKKIVVE
jgi:tripartite-type tricarboxylate transporter receptor subunit TctC